MNRLTVAQQVYHMRAVFPQFHAETNRGNWVRWTGTLQPHELSDQYTVAISYTVPFRPEIRIVSPELRRRSDCKNLPHIFPGDLLCVHTADEWNGGLILARTIVPWTSTWLYFYETWYATGLWLAEGTHPEFPQHRSA